MKFFGARLTSLQGRGAALYTRALFPRKAHRHLFAAGVASLLISTAPAAQKLEAYALAFYADTKTGTTGPVTAEKSFSNSEGSRFARASADYGVLRVFAEAHAANIGGFNLQPSGAQASWQDTVTINSPGLQESQGSLTVKFTIDGSLSCTGGGDAVRDSYAEAAFEFKRDGSLILEGIQSVHFDGSTTGTPFLGIEQRATFTFTYGTPFELRLFIETLARAYHFQGADAEGDLARTATWGGFVSVKDANNNEVTDYSVASASGSDYVAAIGPPKPRLTVEQAGQDIQLSWSTNFTGYALEFSETLSANSWGTVTNSANPSGGPNVVVLPVSGSARFFRLRK